MPSESATAGRAGGVLVPLGIALIVGLVIAYFALGMPGMDHTTVSGMDHTGSGLDGLTSLPPEDFASALGDPDVFVVNVHVPYDGEVPGTDAFIPYDRIVGSAELPTDLNVRILLYCRSGSMSRVAGSDLVRTGHTNVAELAGGMDAWSAAGLEMVSGAGR